MSINRRMNWEDVVHMYNGILLSHKKEWNNAICSTMDGFREYHTKWTMSDRERQISYDTTYVWNLGFPGSSAGKDSTCNAGDLGLIPGSGSCPGEGIGHPLQYSWAFLVVQMVKNPPAMWETWVWSLSWEDPLEEGIATHSSILAWRIPMDRGAWRATVYGVTKSQSQLSD